MDGNGGYGIGPIMAAVDAAKRFVSIPLIQTANDFVGNRYSPLCCGFTMMMSLSFKAFSALLT
jgi:hypothetical protein